MKYLTMVLLCFVVCVSCSAEIFDRELNSTEVNAVMDGDDITVDSEHWADYSFQDLGISSISFAGNATLNAEDIKSLGRSEALLIGTAIQLLTMDVNFSKEMQEAIADRFIPKRFHDKNN